MGILNSDHSRRHQRHSKLNAAKRRQSKKIGTERWSRLIFLLVFAFLQKQSLVLWNRVDVSRTLYGIPMTPTTASSETLTGDSKGGDPWWRGRDTSSVAGLAQAGAKHPNGTMGMVVDPSPKRLLSREFSAYSSICNPKGNHGMLVEGEGGHKVLEKVRRGILKSKAQQQLAPSSRSKILCMVYTQENSHSSLQAVAETWGRQCDGFFAASNITNHSIGAINLMHKGPEEYGNMWQKVLSIWLYAHQHYRTEFDYFHICGDDVYIAVENLRAFLDGPIVDFLKAGHVDELSQRHPIKAKHWTNTHERPLYFGFPVFHRAVTFPAGGPGYTLNRAALDLFASRVWHHGVVNMTDPREDVFIGSVFSDNGVILSNTQDGEGAFRYGEEAETMYHRGGVALWYNYRALKEKTGITTGTGIDSVSEQMVSFHLKLANDRLAQINASISDLVYRYHALLHDELCNSTNDGDGTGSLQNQTAFSDAWAYKRRMLFS